jgi:hypothetical protein
VAVTEVLRGLGQWSIQLDPEKMDDEKWQAIAGSYFGHICIHVGRPDVRVSGDSLLRTSRYTGVYIGTADAQHQRALDGFGMAYWLGDAENKGDVRESLLSFTNSPFDDTIRALLPLSGSVVEGTIHDISEIWSGTHQYQTPLQDIDYVSQTLGAAWRVNGDASLDAGYESHLFVVNPETIVTRKMLNGFDNQASYDMFVRGLDGSSSTTRDVEDFTTRVLLIAQNAEGATSTADADILPGLNPYLDMHGNPVKITRIVQESDTDPTNADARAQLQLNRFTGTRDALTLSTSKYDVKGDLSVGDYLWVCDPLMDLVDVNNEVPFRGKLINPMRLRLTETTWPVVKGYSVMFRTYTGEWFDLTDYVTWETGDTSLVVGGYNRSLTSGGGGVFPVTPPDVNTTVPGQVVWDTPWLQSVYQSPITGESKAEIEFRWQQPANTDLSPITDGAYYEIRYRQSNNPLADYTIDELANYEVDELNTVQDPILIGLEGEWQYAIAPFEVLKFRLQELTPGMTYEAQIRAVDNGRPANLGAWSILEAWQASRDIWPPSTPAAPSVAANPAAVLITHTLGRADGGTFNLDRDLAHLELHASVDPLFAPSDETIVGKIMADWGMLTGNIPAVGSFQIVQQIPMHFKVVAVDMGGNKSNASAPAVATAELWDDKFIRNLTVDKVTAGTISAEWLIGGRITTGGTGARVDITSDGIKGYNALNQLLLRWSNLDGKLTVNGRGGIEINDGALTVKNSSGNVILEVGECLDGRHGIQVYRDNGTRVTRIGELESGTEGIEVIDDLGNLVRVSTLAFGTAAASVATLDNRIGATFGDMGSVGPVTSVVVGNSRRMLVGIGAWCSNASNLAAYASFDVAGPAGYLLPASFFRAVGIHDNGGLGAIGASKFFLIDGLPSAGTYFLAMKYTTLSGVDLGQFSDRHIVVIPF